MTQHCRTCGLDLSHKPNCRNKIHNSFYYSKLKEAKIRQQRARVRAIVVLGGKCVNCGCSDIRVLQVNHRDGNGVKDFQKNGAYAVYTRIINEPTERKHFDVRCANCNILYEYEVGKRKLLYSGLKVDKP